MASGAELIRQVKERIEEVDPREVHDLVEAGPNGTVIVDVREQHEFEEAHLPGAKHVPRGHLESRIETAAPDKSKRVILYCQSGNRSALAADTMQQLLGYEDVASMTGGITLWKDRGFDVEVPQSLTAEQRSRYSRHLLIPEIGLEGQMKLLDAKVLLLGAGGLGSPIALYLAAAGVGTLGIVDDDVVDLSNLQRQVAHSEERIGMPKVDSAEIAIKEINADVNVVKYETRLDASNIMEIIEGYDVIVDGVDNFPTRYLLNDATVRLADPGRLRFDPRLRRPAFGLPSLRGPVLPLPLSDAPAGRARSVVRCERRARRPAGRDGPAPGRRGDQARDRSGRAAHRQAAPVRGPGRDVHRAQGPPRPGLPDLLARPRFDLRRRDGRLPRLRSLLRRLRVACPRSCHSPRSRRSSGAQPGARKRLPSTATTVGDALRSLASQHPDTERQLFGDGGELNRYVNVYKNDEDVRVLDGLETQLSDSDTLMILPAMAGG